MNTKLETVATVILPPTMNNTDLNHLIRKMKAIKQKEQDGHHYLINKKAGIKIRVVAF